MKFTTPNRADFRRWMIEVFVGRRPDAQTGPGSDIAIDVDSITAMGMEKFRSIRRLIAFLWVMTASGEALDDWAYVLGLENGDGGFGRIQESITDEVAAALAVTCTGVCVDLDGEELTDPSGQVFTIEETYTGIAGGETANLALISVATGTAANIPAGTILTFVSTPVNVQDTATMVENMTGAVDEEIDPELRARCLERLQRPGLSGNADQIRDIIEAVNPGVFTAYIWERRDGYPFGYLTFDYAAVYRAEDGIDSIISAADEAAITAAVEAGVPHDQMKGSRQLEVTEDEVAVVAEFILDPDASPSKSSDFDSEDLDAEMTNWVDATLIATADKNVHNHMSAGDYVIIYNARARVNAVGTGDGLPTDANFKVDTSFFTYDAEINPHPWPPGFSSPLPQITSGGGVVEAVHEKLYEYFRTIGPAKGDSAASLLGWKDSYHKLRAQAYMMDADDELIDTGYVSPSDSTPTDPGGTTIPRYMPGQFVIHEDKP